MGHRLRPARSARRTDTRRAGGTGRTVRRSLTLVGGELPEPGTPAELDVRYYPQDPMSADLGLREVTVPGPLGDYPAWLATPFGDAAGDTWAIVVHGNSLSPADGLRMVPILTGAGFPTLVASYRNDPGAPGGPQRQAPVRAHGVEGPGGHGPVRTGPGFGRRRAGRLLDGRRHRDGVPAAVRPRRSGQGGDPGRAHAGLLSDRRRQRLAGGDRAGRAAAALAHRRREATRGVAVRCGLAGAGLPRRHPRRTSGCRSWSSTGPPTTPCRSRRAASSRRLLPDQVQLTECEGAGHIECWNLDPAAYAATVDAFLRATV